MWPHLEEGAPDVADGSDYYNAFATCEEALAFAAEAALTRPRRTPRTIPEALAPDAPEHRPDIRRGDAPG